MEFNTNRRSIRLRDYDYSQEGAYFVTVCTSGGRFYLGRVEDSTVVLLPAGCHANKHIRDIPFHFANAVLDEFVVMPNHVHLIVFLTDKHPLDTGTASDDRVGAQHAEPTPETPFTPIPPVKPGCIGAIVRSFKSATTRSVRRLLRDSDFILWQRNYYEHVIRSEDDLFNCRRYIRENPLRWEMDEYYEA